jgi:pantetheine-phosphate adenylyltransferase
LSASSEGLPVQRARVGVYPGTFDPIHNGHLDVIRRATKLVDRLVIAVAVNAGKDPLFTLAERSRLVEADLNALKAANAHNGARIDVVPFQNLLMHFAAEQRATMVFRGLRAVSDFDYEFQMALNNKRLEPDIETVFLMASESAQFISSRFVREIHGLGGDVSSMVSRGALEALDRKRGQP